MKNYEKKSFFRFMFIYLIVSFLLFIALAIYYYFEQKLIIEEKLILNMNQISKQYLSDDRKKLSRKYSIRIESKDSYPYPAFIKNQKEYIHTSCGNLKNPNTILVVKANKDILQNELDDLKLKIFLFMIITFFINLFIAFILAKISIQPIKEANNRFKTFVDDIIHDLNAPISAIEINLESVQKDYDEKKVQRIDKSLQSIKNIYCNLESILHSQYKNNEETIELHKLCDDIIFEFKPLFGDAEFLIDIPNIKIQINRFIFERILVNILQNSVKYSIDKPKIKLGFDDANQFFIQDNGIGIEDINKVLLRGVQSNNNSQGYGLGLSIVQRLSEQLDIEFKIVSKKEQGTTFYFNLKNHLIRSNEH